MANVSGVFTPTESRETLPPPEDGFLNIGDTVAARPDSVPGPHSCWESYDIATPEANKSVREKMAEMKKERAQQVRQYIRDEAESKYTIITLEEQLQEKIRKLRWAHAEIDRLRAALRRHGLEYEIGGSAPGYKSPVVQHHQNDHINENERNENDPADQQEAEEVSHVTASPPGQTGGDASDPDAPEHKRPAPKNVGVLHLPPVQQQQQSTSASTFLQASSCSKSTSDEKYYYPPPRNEQSDSTSCQLIRRDSGEEADSEFEDVVEDPAQLQVHLHQHQVATRTTSTGGTTNRRGATSATSLLVVAEEEHARTSATASAARRGYDEAFPVGEGAGAGALEELGSSSSASSGNNMTMSSGRSKASCSDPPSLASGPSLGSAPSLASSGSVPGASKSREPDSSGNTCPVSFVSAVVVDEKGEQLCAVGVGEQDVGGHKKLPSSKSSTKCTTSSLKSGGASKHHVDEVMVTPDILERTRISADEVEKMEASLRKRYAGLASLVKAEGSASSSRRPPAPPPHAVSPGAAEPPPANGTVAGGGSNSLQATQKLHPSPGAASSVVTRGRGVSPDRPDALLGSGSGGGAGLTSLGRMVVPTVVQKKSVMPGADRGAGPSVPATSRERAGSVKLSVLPIGAPRAPSPGFQYRSLDLPKANFAASSVAAKLEQKLLAPRLSARPPPRMPNQNPGELRPSVSGAAPPPRIPVPTGASSSGSGPPPPANTAASGPSMTMAGLTSAPSSTASTPTTCVSRQLGVLHYPRFSRQPTIAQFSSTSRTRPSSVSPASETTPLVFSRSLVPASRASVAGVRTLAGAGGGGHQKLHQVANRRARSNSDYDCHTTKIHGRDSFGEGASSESSKNNNANNKRLGASPVDTKIDPLTESRPGTAAVSGEDKRGAETGNTEAGAKEYLKVACADSLSPSPVLT